MGLLHVLTGTPVEVRPIAEALRAANFAVHVPLHVGHRDPDDLAEHGPRNSSLDASECLTVGFPTRGVDVRSFARGQQSPSLRAFTYAAIAELRYCCYTAATTTPARPSTVSVSLGPRSATRQRVACDRDTFAPACRPT